MMTKLVRLGIHASGSQGGGVEEGNRCMKRSIADGRCHVRRRELEAWLGKLPNCIHDP